jgi:hypothetical protein
MHHPRRRRAHTASSRTASIFALAVALGTAATSAEGAVSCTTATRRNLLDPSGAVFGNRFRAPVAINGAGDLLFAARARFAYEKLYLSKSDGSLAVVAATFGSVPNNALIAGAVPFRQLSINDAGDLAFLSPTTRGRALFVKQGPAALEVAAAAGRESPFPPVRYETIHQASSIDESAAVAFIADLRDGTHGIFRYDALTEEVTAVHLAGAATTDGREVCLFEDLELSEAGSIAILAEARSDCVDDTEPTVPEVFLSTGAGIASIVRQGDESPLPGVAYRRFVGRPQMNASDDILFQARLAGAGAGEGLFLRDGATGEIALVVSDGDPLPTGGVIKGLLDARLADDGSVVVQVEIDDASDRFGLFRYAGGVATRLLASTDTPPTDSFTPPHRYTAFEPFFGLSADGATLGLVARVRDGARPPSKSGVLRCTE